MWIECGIGIDILPSHQCVNVSQVFNLLSALTHSLQSCKHSLIANSQPLSEAHDEIPFHWQSLK